MNPLATVMAGEFNLIVGVISLDDETVYGGLLIILLLGSLLRFAWDVLKFFALQIFADVRKRLRPRLATGDAWTGTARELFDLMALRDGDRDPGSKNPFGNSRECCEWLLLMSLFFPAAVRSERVGAWGGWVWEMELSPVPRLSRKCFGLRVLESQGKDF